MIIIAEHAAIGMKYQEYLSLALSLQIPSNLTADTSGDIGEWTEISLISGYDEIC